MSRLASIGFAVAACAAVAIAWSAPAAAGVAVRISPHVQTVTPGSEFEVTIEVTEAGSEFNAFHLQVEYDPSALTLVPLSPMRTQVGSLVTGTCSSLFHMFRQGWGVDTIDVSMLCAGAWVTGPGPIYRLRFRAAATLQQTTLSFRPDAAFANAGIAIAEVTRSDAAVGIGMTPVLDADPAPPKPPSLLASPNPTRGAVTFAFGHALTEESTLAVHDVAGRLVRRIPLPRGVVAGQWDGRDAAGASLPPGRYEAVLRSAGITRAAHVTRVR